LIGFVGLIELIELIEFVELRSRSGGVVSEGLLTEEWRIDGVLQ